MSVLYSNFSTDASMEQHQYLYSGLSHQYCFFSHVKYAENDVFFKGGAQWFIDCFSNMDNNWLLLLLHSWKHNISSTLGGPVFSL